MKRSIKWAAVAVGTTGLVAGAFVGGRAWAGGIPAAGALTYSGLLQDATGAPLPNPAYLEVRFMNDATANAPANVLCDTGTAALTPLINGRFSISLPLACTTTVGSNTGIWVDIVYGTTQSGAASLGARAKLGAVPFAVEANHAVSATTATNATTAANANTLSSAAVTVETAGCVLATSAAGGAYTDCTCAPGEVAIGGGTCTGALCQPGVVLVESRSPSARVWRLTCEDAGTRVQCNTTYTSVVCLKVQ
jgi:hypothetical protein